MLLDINFQFGTFNANEYESGIISELTISAAGAFIGILGAYFIYLVQLKQQRNDTLKYVVTLIASTIKYSKKQSQFCGNLIDKLNKEPTVLHLLQVEANYDIKRLSEKLDQEKFYHSFLSKYRRSDITRKTFKDIYSTIDFIDQTIDQLKDFLEKEYYSIHSKKKEYLVYLEEAEEKAALLLVNEAYISNDEKSTLLKFINDIIIAYKKTPHNQTDLNHPYDSFILPLLGFLIKNYPRDTKANEIAILLRKSAVKYELIKTQSENLAGELVKYKSSLEKHSQNLFDQTIQYRNDFLKMTSDN